MDCIQKDAIFISSLQEAQDHALLLREGITDILTIGPDMPPLFNDFRYKICLVDDDLNSVIYSEFAGCFSFIDNALGEGGKVLVHCEAGMSRSATMCIGYIMWKRRATLKQVLDEVKAVRPKINPNECFLQQLELLERSSYNLDSNDAEIAESLSHFDRQRLHKPTVVHADVFMDPTDVDRKTSTAVDDVIPQLVEMISKSENVDEGVEPFHTSDGEITEDEYGIAGKQPLEGSMTTKCDIDVPVMSSSQSPAAGSPDSDLNPGNMLTRLKPRSSSASFPKSEVQGDEEENGSPAAELALLEAEKEEACPKENAAMVVERVLLGYTPTNKDEQKVSDFLAATEIPPAASKAFTGLRQALRMMKKVVCHNDEVGAGDRPRDASHVQGLRQSLQHVSSQLERYTGYPMNSAAFVELLRSRDGLQVVMDKIEQEYNAALEAVRQEKEDDSKWMGDCTATLAHAAPRKAFTRTQSNPIASLVRKPAAHRLKPNLTLNSCREDDCEKVNEIENECGSKANGRRRIATIEMLLLFAKLGLRRSIRQDLSDMAYAKLSQLLEGGSREKAALETIDQGSLIELLRYLDLNSPKPNEVGLQRLAHVCEARLILMVEANTAAPICDALIALPKVRGAIRRVATYALHFSGAVIGTRLALSQRRDEIQVARSLSTSPYEAYDDVMFDKKGDFALSPELANGSTKSLAHTTSAWTQYPQHSLFRRGSDWVHRLWNSHSNDALGTHPAAVPLAPRGTISSRQPKQRRRFFRSKKPQELVLQTLEQFDPVMAMRGLLKHVSTVAGTHMGAQHVCPAKKLQQLKEHAAELGKVHPFICVADNEKRPGLRDMPKASTVLEQNLKITRYSCNQTRKYGGE